MNKDYTVRVTVEINVELVVLGTNQANAEGAILLGNAYDDKVKELIIEAAVQGDFEIRYAEAAPEEGDLCPYCEFDLLVRTNANKLICPHCTERALYAQDMVWGEDDPPPSPYIYGETDDDPRRV